MICTYSVPAAAADHVVTSRVAIELLVASELLEQS